MTKNCRLTSKGKISDILMISPLDIEKLKILNNEIVKNKL
jgi:hypothetical protein